MRYYIADLHFYHYNLLTKMDNRPFDSVEEMEDYIVERWNQKVRKNDEVIILGDLSFGNGPETQRVIERLNGRLFLIKGNHDHRYLDDKNFDPSCFGWIKDYAELRDNNRKVVLSHYPICFYNGQYRRTEHGLPTTYMLYGHVHNTRDEVLLQKFIHQIRETEIFPEDPDDHNKIPCAMINCFCMFSDYQPLTLDEWIEVQKQREQSFEALD